MKIYLNFQKNGRKTDENGRKTDENGIKKVDEK